MTIAPLAALSREPAQLYLGIDGGGTKCRACLVDGRGEVLGEGMGGSANAFVNLQMTQDSIVTAARQALASAGLGERHLSALRVGAGLAGVNVPNAAKTMQEWQHPFAQFEVVSDLHAACLGAHEGRNGRVIVLGTGSCGASLVDGHLRLLGGHGLTLGDQASGAWFGREAIAAALLAQDGLSPITEITHALKQQAIKGFGEPVSDWVSFMQGRSTADFARLSPAVFIAANLGDATATAIIKRAAHYVDALALTLSPKSEPSLPLAFVGGLMPFIRPWLSEPLQQAEIAAAYPPEIGVLFLDALDRL